MKKILKILFIFIIMFGIYESVYASCFMGNGASDSDYNATHGLYDAGDQNGAINTCGPYFSIDNAEPYVLFVTLYTNEFSGKGRVSKIYLDYNIGDTHTGSEYYQDSIGMVNGINVCPNYLYETNNTDKIGNDTLKVYDTSQNRRSSGKGFYYQKEVKTCRYNGNNIRIVNYTDENGKHYLYMTSNALNKQNNSIARIGNSIDFWFKDTQKLEDNGVTDQNIIDDLKKFEISACPDIYYLEYSRNSDFHHFFPTESLAKKYQSSSNYSGEVHKLSGTAEGYSNHMDNTYSPFYTWENGGYKICSSDEPDCVNKFSQCNDDKNCIMTEYYGFSKIVREMSEYCNNVYSTCNYKDNATQYCLKIDDQIKQIRDEFNISNVAACGMSDRIIRWLANIVKWVKYIAPVLVIILGILDFIKAFASGNDDEMKKVKARFVKRLISAALLFIVPFIIEFILDVFNLVTDNPYCNLF